MTTKVVVPDDYATIQDAIDDVPGGETKYIVIVEAGTHDPFTIPSTMPPTVIRGASKPIINATGNDYGALVQAPDVVLQDLDIRDATLANVGQDTGGDDLIIRRCTLQGGPRGYVCVPGDGSVGGLQILSVLIHGVTTVGIDLDNLSGTVSIAYVTAYLISDDDALPDDTRAILVDGTSMSSLFVRNSVFSVWQTSRTAVIIEAGIPGGVSWTQDRNVFHTINGALAGRFSTTPGGPFTDYETLEDWQGATAKDLNSLEGDPGFEDPENDLFFLRQSSIGARSGESLGVADVTHTTDDDWADVIRAVDYPSSGAHEIHDVIPFKGAGRLLGIIFGIIDPIDQVTLGTGGLEDEADIFRPIAFPRDEGDFRDPFFSGGAVSGSVSGSRASLTTRVQVTPVNAYALAKDRIVKDVSEIGLADGEGGLVAARRIRSIPMDPVLPSYTVETGTVISFPPSPVSQGQWVSRPFAAGPGPRNRGTAGFDPDRDRYMFFGGIDGTVDLNNVTRGDIWEFDPFRSEWAEVTPASGPGAMSQSIWTYDTKRKVFWMAAGIRSGVHQDELWKYDPSANTWTLMTPPSSPGARAFPGVAYNPVRDRVLFFGGRSFPSDTLMDDTWEWDPNTETWSQLSPATTPPGREGGRMLFRPATGTVYMFGLWDSDPGPDLYLSDLWEFDGTDWTLIEADGTPGQPSSRATWGVMDPIRDRIIIFAGSPAFGQDTWERIMSTGEWVQTTRDGQPGIPARRRGNDMAYRPKNNSMMLYGGIGQTLDTLGDMWEYRMPLVN
jgi:hypothetical protein